MREIISYNKIYLLTYDSDTVYLYANIVHKIFKAIFDPNKFELTCLIN